MRETRGVWAEVQTHSYIKDRNGKTWRVDKISSNRVRLVDRDGKQVDIARPPAGREVDLFEPTEEEARYTLASALGARILATRDLEGDYKAPLPETWDEAAARWHLDRFHRIYPGSEATLAELRGIHDRDSIDPVIRHDHTEDL
jgi:hypothetical protein